MLRPSGKHLLEFEKINKSYTQPDGKVEHVLRDFTGAVMRGDKVVLVGRNGQGIDDVAQGNYSPEHPELKKSTQQRSIRARSSGGTRAADRLLRAGSHGRHPEGNDRS